jgi:hypothetical protein
MAALGQCQTLLATNPVPYFVVNEVSTVAAVAALKPYMSSLTNVGSGTSDAAALATAFTLASEFANTNSGVSPGTGVPSTLVVPTAQINTLADIVAACVNSTGGVAGDGSACGTLFADANLPSTPTTVIGALLNMFANPTNNIIGLQNLASGVGAPFQPTLSAPPPNWTVALATAQPPISASPSPVTLEAAVSAVATQNITITNNGTSTVTLSGLTITGANPSAFYIAGGNCPTSLGPAGTCFITIGLYVTTAGTYYADLSIANGGSVTPVYVPLTGTAP